MKEIRKAIESVLTKNKKIIIYPFGFYGKMVKEILNKEYSLHEDCIIDNFSNDQCIRRITDLDKSRVNDYCYLIACKSDVQFTEIVKTLDELKVNKENVVDVFGAEHYYHLYAPTFMIYDAHRQGLNLAQYYEKHYNSFGIKSDTIIDKIAEIIDISARGSICEIGPGSGRFLVKLIEKFKPRKYEFYEIEKKLEKYITENYHYEECSIIDREANGVNLEGTETGSQDLVFESNVFSLIKYSYTYKYFLEMIRVCKEGGYIVFDAHTEEALTEEALDNDENYVNEWRIIPQVVIENIFRKRKMKLIQKFNNLMIGGNEDVPHFNIVETWYVYKKESL